MLNALNGESRRLMTFFSVVGIIIITINLYWLSGIEMRLNLKNITMQGLRNLPQNHNEVFEKFARVNDNHPIAKLMRDADSAWRQYTKNRSMSFSQTVEKYRDMYGRNPPPGFSDWYRFARERKVQNIDDFQQIIDDLRPFWGIEPSIIRSHAAHLHENPDHGISSLHIRNKKIWKLTNVDWRMETFSEMVKPFMKFLPDMDIAMNRLDQPRVIVPWNDIQDLLKKEIESRRINVGSRDRWTKRITGLFGDKSNESKSTLSDAEFFPAHGQQYMKIARDSCPPDSPARNAVYPPRDIEKLYKSPESGFIINFNLSSDICTVGPVLEDKHGFLFAPSTIWATRKLVPIFGESKTSVNSDILFPANMYYRNDERYNFDPTHDYDWDDKKDCMIWRGVTSGGVNTAENWRKMHRQRLVAMTDASIMANKKTRIMRYSMNAKNAHYYSWLDFNASSFIKDHTDVGFTGSIACAPNCDFYKDILTYKKMITLGQQFTNKYLVDIDGHSFSGRWHAFLQSKSLAIKSTIFKEWHDSRLFAWRHFIPMDNRYDDLYSILTYFIGLGSPMAAEKGEPYVQRHDFEARKIGQQGREWAAKTLRREDIEVYLYRLLLEYARVIDDNRDEIGYNGDGSEMARFDALHPGV
ncbi:Beta-1,2-xylosyltransferase 1 [Golovinomyces cichoracearum]|uniref:Beta-1,2-xylosyltransferase 1 n=1 Tax=Golovinomyces cichoracearum TaxID=62708 RepID=A0A420J9Q6_9PEZI|nr:Beta-1,2-xylosyltransferase 1 [Golovinomyces cichoracearum]